MKPGFSFGGTLERILGPGLYRPEQVSHPSGDFSADEKWMVQAYLEALGSVGVTHPNPAVGCVLVDRFGNEISRGATQAYPGLHAERLAFSRIKNPKSLKGGKAYVTLEPCTHQGQQPPCVSLFENSGLEEVHIARTDPFHLVNGGGLQRLKELGIRVQVGNLGQEATAWNYLFFAYEFLKRPIIGLKWAQTLDGQLADDWGQSQWISGPESRSYAHWLRLYYDGIMVGARTLLTDLPSLTARNCQNAQSRVPLPIIIDPKGILFSPKGPEKQKILNTSFFKDQRRVAVFTTPDRASSQSWLTSLPTVYLKGIRQENFFHKLLKELDHPEFHQFYGKPFRSILVEGGPRLLSSLIQAGMGDLLHVFVTPQLTSGNENRIQLFRRLEEATRFELICQNRLGSDVLMEMIPSSLKKAIFG